MIKIIFVRHGRNNGDKLTRLGKRQAKIAAYELDYENVDKIYCSPKARAIQTANILAKRLGIKDVVVDKRITEREKISADNEGAELFNQNYLNPNFSCKKPEGCKEYYDRVVGFLDDLIEKCNGNETILIVGHSSMSYVMNAYFCKRPRSEDLTWIRLGNCSKLCFEYEKKGE